ncbi:polyprenol reductase isoform X2 [Callorhinchus milii]|uniref:polyprenol reductase isoform X2 n=1 Tax=Callorhinchus milii TaxID=7868 RepID=UPI001C3FC355|nr:polyprenol reductase isoform X2 [Callorhinchus milii]
MMAGGAGGGVGVLAVLWLMLSSLFAVALLLHRWVSRGRGRGLAAVLFQDMMFYGKSRGSLERPPWLQRLDLPKRWFIHFYVVSVTWNGLLLAILCQNLFWGQPFPMWLQRLLSFVSGSQLHMTPVYKIQDLLVQYRWYHVAGLTLFFWATVHHHKSHIILASLRKNKLGEVVNLSHRVPHGDWFEQVSCPHYLAELLIYLALAMVFGGRHLTWWSVVLYVLSSHAMMAVQSHEFYVNKFENYPKNRKAFIPLIF